MRLATTRLRALRAHFACGARPADRRHFLRRAGGAAVDVNLDTAIGDPLQNLEELAGVLPSHGHEHLLFEYRLTPA